MAKAKSPKKMKIDLKTAIVEAVDPKLALREKPKFEYPYWSNKEAKHIIVTLVHADGRRHLASIMDKDGTNPDYKAVFEEFTEAQLDENTAEGLKRRNDNVRQSMERREAEAARAAQENLFAAKLEAFEIPSIKTSKNTDFKKLIRKSKSPMEVVSYATLLIGEERTQDPLVTAKTEALDIPEIKASRDELKQRIHKATSITEVNAFTAVILGRELAKL